VLLAITLGLVFIFGLAGGWALTMWALDKDPGNPSAPAEPPGAMPPLHTDLRDAVLLRESTLAGAPPHRGCEAAGGPVPRDGARQ
jgi:hypothetical protein